MEVNCSSLNQGKDKQVLTAPEEARVRLSHPVLSGFSLTDSQNQRWPPRPWLLNWNTTGVSMTHIPCSQSDRRRRHRHVAPFLSNWFGIVSATRFFFLFIIYNFGSTVFITSLKVVNYVLKSRELSCPLTYLLAINWARSICWAIIWRFETNLCSNKGHQAFIILLFTLWVVKLLCRPTIWTLNFI